MADRVFRTNAPSVVSEIIDGEAVIINLKSGNYYSTLDIGSQVWHWIGEGRPTEAIVEVLSRSHAAGGAEIAAAIDAFVEDLLDHELIVPGEPSAHSGEIVWPVAAGEVRVFVAPTLNAYSDMRDLLLLDPIHDVDESGWPRQRLVGEA